MNPIPYVQRRIDGALIELLPDGSVMVRPERGEPFTLAPDVAYALYLFCRMPGIGPTLRQRDAERQHHIFETRHGTT